MESPAPEKRWSSAQDPYDPEDGLQVRFFDLVVSPGASLDVLEEREVQVIEPLHQDPLGRQVITIRSVGRTAAALAPAGLIAEGHRSWFQDEVGTPDLGVTRQATTSACPPSPSLTSSKFASFDAVTGAYKGGIRAEIYAMNTTTTPVITVATTHEQRPVMAVRVGPLTRPWTLNVPTVYVLGTHHAREWTSQEVTLRLLRWAKQAASDPADPLNGYLQDRALVFVPVVNPDGYQYSRTTYRDQRKNRQPGCLPGPSTMNSTLDQGTDINRNYNFMWKTSGDSISTDACLVNYIGTGAASEPETVGIQNLLTGALFPQGSERPAALVTYHSYGDIITYPGGLKAASDTQGPACDANSNCLNPDFHVYRRLFGDTENPILRDNVTPATTGQPLYRPYQADQLNNVLYTLSGDLTSYAQYGGPNVVAVNPELTSSTIDQYIECEPNADAILDRLVAQQQTLIRRLLIEAPSLVASTSDYARNNFGNVALGGFAREVKGTFDQQSARPSLQVHLAKAVDTGPALTVTSSVNNNPVTLTRNRPGVHFSSWGTSFDQLNPSDPYCVPCQINIRSGVGSAGVSTGCSSGCLNLKDPNRLPHTSGWQLVRGQRPSTSTLAKDEDWWWQVTGSSQDEVLTIPSFTPPANTTQCALSFTTIINPGNQLSSLVLERLQGSTWQVLTSWKLDTPFPETRSVARLRSYLFEANGLLPSSTPQFRFRLPAGQASSINIFEPLIMCRWGNVP